MPRFVRWVMRGSALVAAFAATGCAETLPCTEVHEGISITLDGNVADGEWEDALVIALDPESTLHLKHADGFLFLGFRGHEAGVGNLLIVLENDVRVLHSSAALGTAVYAPAGNAWHLQTDFTWSCRDRGSSPAAAACRDTFLEQEGWVASIVYQGRAEEMEYQVLLPEDRLRMVFLFLPVANPAAILSWPADVDQDAFPGPIPQVAHFDLAQWAEIRMILDEH